MRPAESKATKAPVKIAGRSATHINLTLKRTARVLSLTQVLSATAVDLTLPARITQMSCLTGDSSARRALPSQAIPSGTKRSQNQARLYYEDSAESVWQSVPFGDANLGPLGT